MTGVERLLVLDAKSGTAAVPEVRRLREIEEGLAGDPLYLELRGERLAAAERFAALARGADDLSPADALRRAHDDVADADHRLDQIGASRGLRASLGLEESAPVSILPAVWFAAVVAAAIPADFRDLLRWEPEGDEAAFRAAFEDWTRLCEAEREFERTFGRYPPKGKLNASLLREHADLLDESLVGLKFWKREALGIAKATADGLGIAGNQADGLRRLANHVVAVDAFVADPANAALAGVHWNGLATPFDRLTQALRLRSLVREMLAPYADGAAVAGRVCLRWRSQRKNWSRSPRRSRAKSCRKRGISSGRLRRSATPSATRRPRARRRARCSLPGTRRRYQVSTRRCRNYSDCCG